jgi:hypothetical protein
LSSPYREALNQRNKKVERKKIKKLPRNFFLETYSVVFRVFELPLPRNAQKRTSKKRKKEEGTYVRTFFCELAQVVRRFPVLFFSAAPRPLAVTGSELIPGFRPAGLGSERRAGGGG